MPEINVKVLNEQGSSYEVHVFDQFGGGSREVGGSPFALASGEQSGYFIVNADNNGGGHIAYNCQVNGPTLSNIEVSDGQIVPIT